MSLHFWFVWGFFHQELLQLEDRLGSVSRGAVQTTIERFTFPHKYKKVGHYNKKVCKRFKGPILCKLLFTNVCEL